MIIEFPNREAAESWYNSDAYQKIIHHRQNNAISYVIVADGFVPPESVPKA